MNNHDSTDVHEQGTLALVRVARAAIQALKVAVLAVETDPKNAHKSIGVQATLLSKTVSSLASKMDHLPPDTQAQDMNYATANAVNIDTVQDALQRLQMAAEGHTCVHCGLVLPSAP